MKVLIAEDDLVSRRILDANLTRWGYEVISVEDGKKAWEVLRSADSPLAGYREVLEPRLVVLDWMMPGTDGVEICRKLREREGSRYVYIILLTAKARKEDVRAGLEAGADDYLTKPYDPEELRCRIGTGDRILTLKSALEERLRDLEKALAHVKQLQGLLPICMYCKKIRDARDTWHRLETYIQDHSEAMFSHSLCAECLQKHFPEQAADISGGGAAS